MKILSNYDCTLIELVVLNYLVDILTCEDRNLPVNVECCLELLVKIERLKEE